MPGSALVLGLGGLLPFICAVVVMLTNAQNLGATAAYSLLVYGAVIVSFLGGIRWGVEISHHPQNPRWLTLIGSVITSLIAWPAVMTGGTIGFLMLIAAFVFQYVLDSRAVAQHQIVSWFRPLRFLLTSVVVLCLLAGLWLL